MIMGAWGLGKKSGGPELLEYVVTNATQYSSNWNTSYQYIGAYLDTGYKVTPQTTLEVECGWNEYQSQSWDSPVGSGASGVWNNSLVAIFRSWGHPYQLEARLLHVGYAELHGVAISAPTEMMKFILGPQDGFKFWGEDGSLLYSEPPHTPPATGAQYSLYIGATNYGGTMVNPMIGRIRRVTISENGNVVKNFLAAKSEGVCGFWESIVGTFHQSESATAFTEGV